MKYFFYGVFVLLLTAAQPGRAQTTQVLFSKDNLVAWCVVPFDSMQRTPEQRAQMLDDLGFKNFAYDWRTKHIPSFPDEIKALRKHDINLSAVWIWIERDSSGKILDPANERIFDIVKNNHVKTDFWLGFSNSNFEGLTEEQKLNKAVSAVQYLHDRAKEIGCSISLYNHGDWFGEPLNQVRIIEKTGLKDIGVVYNFHHAHLQVSEFPKLLKEMLPYLRTVNLNGMKVQGPKILTIGEGDKELEMLNTLKASGYKGSIGIICHIENEDAKEVLARNVAGLKSLLKAMGDQKALRTYK
jgi:hypothetical protein